MDIQEIKEQIGSRLGFSLIERRFIPASCSVYVFSISQSESLHFLFWMYHSTNNGQWVWVSLDFSTAWLAFTFPSLFQLLLIGPSHYVRADCFQRLFNLAVAVVKLPLRARPGLTLSLSDRPICWMFHTHCSGIDIYPDGLWGDRYEDNTLFFLFFSL